MHHLQSEGTMLCSCQKTGFRFTLAKVEYPYKNIFIPKRAISLLLLKQSMFCAIANEEIFTVFLSRVKLIHCTCGSVNTLAKCLTSISTTID